MNNKNIKAAILHDSDLQDKWLQEMAAKELKQVESMIKAGEVEAAARKYISLGGSPRSNAVSRTVNSYISKNPNIDPTPFSSFKKAVLAIKLKEFPAKTVKYKKAVQTGKTKEGKIVAAGRSAKSQKEVEKKQLKRMAKVMIKSEEELLTKSIPEKKQIALDMYSDQVNSGDVRILQAWVKKDKPGSTEISDVTGQKKLVKSKQVVDRDIAINIIAGSVPDKERGKISSRLKRSSDKKISFVADKLLTSWKKDLDILKQFGKTGEQQKEAEEIIKQSLTKGIENLKVVGGSTFERKREKKSVEESTVNLYEEVLKDSHHYRGDMFWENYILSNLVRAFPEHIVEYGNENAIEMFVDVFGEKARPLFEYMVDAKEVLFETALVVGSGLLFEGVGERNVEQYLRESDGILQSGGKSINFSPMLSKLRKTGAETATGVFGFLKGLWEKLKVLGAGIFNKVKPFLISGFTWAKEIVKKGVAWIGTSPIARVAIPVVLIAGSLIGAKKLINKIRQKTGKKRITPEEEGTLKNIIGKNKGKIERLKRKAGVKE